MKVLVLGAHRIELGPRPLLMGIVNATPDSFFDRGRHFKEADPEPTARRALELVAQGADIVDVGGETAQPSSPVLAPDEEIRRVVPVIEALAGELGARVPAVPISVDTYKPAVARAAIRAGASLINDTSGLADEELGEVAAETGAAIVVMHIPCHPKQRITPGYPDPVGAISSFLAAKTARLLELGVPRDRIVVDPGIGFGKTPDESLVLTAHLDRLQDLGYPVLYACSRRTFLGDLMGGQPPEARLEATVAVNAAAVMKGADLLRVHDVAFFAKLVRMLAMVRQKSEAGAPGERHRS